MGTTNGKQQIEVRRLPVRLTEAEMLKRGDELAAIELAIEGLKAERAAVNAKIGEEVKNRGVLAHTIDRGTEERDVQCTWVEDFPRNVYRLKRDDDGKEVDTRPMSASDRTGSLFAQDVEAELGVPPPRKSAKKPAKKRQLTAVP